MKRGHSPSPSATIYKRLGHLPCPRLPKPPALLALSQPGPRRGRHLAANNRARCLRSDCLACLPSLPAPGSCFMQDN